MTPELYQRVRLLFDEAMSRPESLRLTFLQQECAGDAELLTHVELLLRAHLDAQGFLEDTDKPEKQIGRYRITEMIGRGTMGIVYGAFDPVIHRPVAIKVIQLPSLAGRADANFLRERLFREAHLAGSLSHPGIVTIYDLGEQGGQAYIAMERIWGPSLQTVLESGPRLTLPHGMDILRQVASALDYAHARRVVHRDVKPANILLQEGRTAKVVDFGIAKILSTQEQTLTGFAAGTPSYMSPEQIKSVSADGRSDQFSLAAIAFEILTGTKPFHAESLPALAHAIVYGDRPSAHAKNRMLPAKVDGVFYRALNVRPEQRYSSCKEMITALGTAMGNISASLEGPAFKGFRLATTRYLVGIGVLVVTFSIGLIAYRSVVLMSTHRAASNAGATTATTATPTPTAPLPSQHNKAVEAQRHSTAVIPQPPTSGHILPIQIANDQATDTPVPFATQVVVDSSVYSSFESPNLDNLQFSDQTGHVIPSWLESGNSSSSTRTVYWLRLVNGIPAKSAVTVYMVFAPVTHNMLNNTTTGEAPGLSLQYGRYDNGAQVFTRYANFAGTSLPAGWSDSFTPGSAGTVTVNNGVTLSQAGAGDQRTFLGSDWIVGDNVVEMHLLLQSTANGQDMIMFCTRNGRLNGLTPNFVGFQNGSGLEVENNSGGGPSILGQANPNPTLPAVIGFHGDQVFGNYEPVIRAGKPICGSTFLAASANTGSTASFEFDWVRMRPAPPGDTMPRIVVARQKPVVIAGMLHQSYHLSSTAFAASDVPPENSAR